MYTALGPNRFAQVILLLFAVVIVVLVWLADGATSPWPVIRTLGFATSVFALILYFLLGMPWYWSPWRILWRKFPVLNEWLYPDLNGVWYGTTSSNWPVISKLREATAQGDKVDLSELDKVELLKGDIAMNVRASFFGISIRSKLQDTGGDSKTIAARAGRSSDPHEFTLSYLYRQTTPEPQSTDEESHVGAATLEVKPGDKPQMEGEYWTRRKWREGMNTAGIIRVMRVSDQRAPTTENLLEFARKKAGDKST